MFTYTVKKVVDFPVPSREVTNQTLPGGDNLIIPVQGEFVSDIPAEDGKIDNLFLQCIFDSGSVTVILCVTFYWFPQL